MRTEWRNSSLLGWLQVSVPQELPDAMLCISVSFMVVDHPWSLACLVNPVIQLMHINMEKYRNVKDESIVCRGDWEFWSSIRMRSSLRTLTWKICQGKHTGEDETIVFVIHVVKDQSINYCSKSSLQHEQVPIWITAETISQQTSAMPLQTRGK